jgi:hypothetical protein
MDHLTWKIISQETFTKSWKDMDRGGRVFSNKTEKKMNHSIAECL